MLKDKNLDAKQSLTHIDAEGNAQMVDIGKKPVQRRVAKAAGRVFMKESTCKAIAESSLKKGDVLTVAKIAGIQGAKNTANLIPLCHPLLLDKIDVELTLEKGAVAAISEVHCTCKTGVEMEALTAVSVALLTVYDMCKAVDKEMSIGEIELLEKVKLDD